MQSEAYNKIVLYSRRGKMKQPAIIYLKPVEALPHKTVVKEAALHASRQAQQERSHYRNHLTRGLRYSEDGRGNVQAIKCESGAQYSLCLS